MDSSLESARGEWAKDNLPKLREAQCDFQSRATWDYNCVGLATGDFLWWHPEERDEHYWPEGIKRDLWATTYIKALETVHFSQVSRLSLLLQVEPSPVEGFETIAVLHKGGLFKHVAMQVRKGVWKSKLGEYEDLEHPFSAMLKGTYGKVFAYMRRPIVYGGVPLPAHYKLNQ